MRRINIEKVKEIIDEFDLKNPCRKDWYKWNRYEVFHFLLQTGRPLDRIAGYFNKDHATVINGIKRRKILMGYNDYQEMTEQVRTRLELCYEDSPIEYPTATDFEKLILKAECLAEFLFIKGKLLNEIKRR